jgi:hypothetical protein
MNSVTFLSARSVQFYLGYLYSEIWFKTRLLDMEFVVSRALSEQVCSFYFSCY